MSKATYEDSYGDRWVVDSKSEGKVFLINIQDGLSTVEPEAVFDVEYKELPSKE